MTALGERTLPVAWEEVTVPTAAREGLEESLRLLARWLVAASSKGAPGGADSPAADPENPLDVAPGPKVLSKSE